MHWFIYQAECYVYEDHCLALEELESNPLGPYHTCHIGCLGQRYNTRCSNRNARGFHHDFLCGSGKRNNNDSGPRGDRGGKKWAGEPVPLVGNSRGAVKGRMMRLGLTYLLPGLLATWFPLSWRIGRDWSLWGYREIW